MFVRKFEGDSLDEALQAVKKELGPDAIILKTVSNKGLKGAFKKSRIEITAAISEQNYEKKARVDHVLSDEQKQSFYQTPASRINNMINEYDEHRINNEGTAAGNGYGQLGLNRVVKTVSKASNKIKNSLDDFLALEEEEEQGAKEVTPPVAPQRQRGEYLEQPSLERRAYQTETHDTSDVSGEFKEQLKSQKHQIEMLEQKLFELTQKLSEKTHHDKMPKGLQSLRNTLKSLELSESIVQTIIKKASFELDSQLLNDADSVYEFALRELNDLISVEMPLFSKVDIQDKPVVTVLISESSAGQSSMAYKLAVLQENVKVIRLRESSVETRSESFASKMFDLDTITVENLSHLMGEARKASQEGQSMILDLKLSFKDKNETKKFLDMIKRSFENVEILLNISSIHSELYNRKLVHKYKNYAQGMVVSFLDQCLSYGPIFNIHMESDYLPLKFFGTGPMVPDDIEAATAERLLAGMFQF